MRSKLVVLVVPLLCLWQRVAAYQPLLTAFCTNWTGKCNTLKKEWEVLYSTYGNELEMAGVALKWIDADLEPRLTQKERVTSYPTIKFSTDNIVIIYGNKKDLNASSLMAFVRESYISPCTEIKSSAEAKYASNKDTVAYYQGPVDTTNSSSQFSVFRAAAALHRAEDPSTTFLYTPSKELAIPKVTLYTTLGEERHYDEDFTVDSLLEFISIFKHGQIINCNNTGLIDEMFVRELSVLFGFFNDSNQAAESKWLERFQEVARNRRDGGLVFAHCNVDDQSSREMFMDQFPHDKTPSFGILEFEQEAPVRYSLQVEKPEDLEEQLRQFNEGKLNPQYLSEQVPEPEQNTGPVIKLVGSNYEENVANPNIHAVVLLLREGGEDCPRCPPALKELTKVAERYQNDKRVSFYKIDTGLNEAPDILNANIPEVLLYVKGKNKGPISMDRKITEKNILKFIFKLTDLPG